MAWWKRKPGERAQWLLNPLVGVGPLRFGMCPDEVKAALGGVTNSGSQVARSGSSWERYGDAGVTAIHGPGMLLVAVAIDAMSGPLVRFRDVELIARVPSEVRADIDALARQEGVEGRVNWGGDPEVAAWGLSMGAAQAWELSSEGYVQRTDRMISEALLVAPELAEDPYGAETIVHWWDIREQPVNPGGWPVTADQDRRRWEWTPLESVGPLRFGMSPQQVAAALGGEVPAARRGHFPHYWYRESGQWYLNEDRFDAAGVTAHYWYREGVPTLGAVTVHGRTGPQVDFDGIDLIGKTVSTIDAALEQRAENEEMGLVIGCSGDLGPAGLNMYVRATRAGDVVVSEARFCTADWEDHG
ncbi:hypothetical protein [Streptomyces kebangsaanensis]|uniref:hypothetical protein n=1 Tax=Streptomyces kebangsaanensis TaxID=864058 RepID=UPI0009392770|nr:hypothetical protein [Streptomyces kebangsaanensis]